MLSGEADEARKETHQKEKEEQETGQGTWDRDGLKKGAMKGCRGREGYLS
jgi:hypothetical protein